MAKTVTLRIDEGTYRTLKEQAERDRRTLANFIEYAAMKYLEAAYFADDVEMAEISNHSSLVERLKKGSQDAAKKKGKFVS